MKMRYFSPKFGFIFILSAGLFNPGFRTVRAQDAGLNGQLAGWGTCQPENAWQTQTGLRYIPLLSMNQPVTETINLDIEASANMYGIVQGGRRMRPFTQGEIKPYRLWLRISSPRQEIRLGLQKINFGSAVMLRPLMWFDRLDPRDPLQITDGISGILGRYFFRKKVNLWLWALYGNDEVKGWEFIPTRERTVEWGGRLQVPVPEGEIGLSYHQRCIDTEKAGGGIFSLAGTQPEPADWNFFDLEPVTERRIGFDGKWDIAVGFWIEGMLVHQKTGLIPYIYQRAVTLGLDYTFGIGNGLHAMVEYFRFELTEKAFGRGEGMKLTACSMDYPLGLLDSFTGMIYYDGENRVWYRFLNWRRLYDRIGIHLILFWNPDRFQIYQTMTENTLYTGRGFQIMLVFNH